MKAIIKQTYFKGQLIELIAGREIDVIETNCKTDSGMNLSLIRYHYANIHMDNKTVMFHHVCRVKTSNLNFN